MDARELAPPFTPGALRGGTHLHTFSGDGQRIAFTYEDHVLAGQQGSGNADENQRNVGVAARGAGPVRVSQRHPRNHDGEWFSVLVTCTVNRPRPGSDQISRACEEAWIGRSGYVTRSGERRRGIAFQGTVASPRGESFAEVFAVDLPEDITAPSESGPLEGTATRRPQPPRGTTQRRLTFTCERRYPGLAGPRHWLHSSPDGSQIAFLMRDDDGVVQLWTVSPLGGEPRQVTENAFDIASAFTWSADGERVAHVMDGSVCVSHVPSGQTVRLTPPAGGERSPRPEACVFSPDGRRIAYVRRVGDWNQVFVCEVE
jgi:WD40 repeat protein